MSNERGDVMGDGQLGRGFVPKLRFPEFRGANPWPVKPLGELARRQSKRNSDHVIIRVLTNSAEQGVVDQRDYFDKDIAIQGNLDAYFIVEHGDYVYNPRISNAAPVGPIGKNKVGTGVMSPLYTVFRFSEDNDSFYEQYFRCNYWHSYLRHASNSGARHDRMAITNDDFMQMPLPAPVRAEQQKITDCLSSLDAVIAAEGDRLAALKAHKKSLMQQLFPTPGQTTPRRRFPEFEGADEWAVKPLGEIFDTASGGTPDRQKKEYWDGKIPWITTSLVDANVISEATEFITENGLKNSSAKIFPEGTVLIAMYGQGKTRGKVALLGIEAARP